MGNEGDADITLSMRIASTASSGRPSRLCSGRVCVRLCVLYGCISEGLVRSKTGPASVVNSVQSTCTDRRPRARSTRRLTGHQDVDG